MYRRGLIMIKQFIDGTLNKGTRLSSSGFSSVKLLPPQERNVELDNRPSIFLLCIVFSRGDYQNSARLLL